MKTGNLIFVKGNSPIDRAIEYFDNGPFNHVCMAMPNNTIVESQYMVNTRCIPNPYKQSEIVVVDLNLTNEQSQKLINDQFKYLPYKYDLKQIFGILFHKLFKWATNKTWNNKNKLICSELVVDLLTDIGYFTSHNYFYNVSNITPNQLYKILKKLNDDKSIAN